MNRLVHRHSRQPHVPSCPHVTAQCDEGENVWGTPRVVYMRPKLQRHRAVGTLGLGGYQRDAVCSYASKVEQLAPNFPMSTPLPIPEDEPVTIPKPYHYKHSG